MVGRTAGRWVAARPFCTELNVRRSVLNVQCFFLLAFLGLAPSLFASAPTGYYLAWSDEFNSTNLDLTKWDYWLLGSRRQAVNVTNAVSLNGSNLVITTYTTNSTHYTAMLATDGTFRSRYGYWETSAKWSDTNGMWSAFWMQSPTMGADLDDPFVSGSEIDIAEHRYVDGSANSISGVVQNNIHWNGYGSAAKSAGSGNIGSGLGSGFHTYGFLWTPSVYTLYVDGGNLRSWSYANNGVPISESTEFFILSSEVDNSSTTWAGYTPSGGYGNLGTSAAKLTVDYVRYYAPTTMIFWTGAGSFYWTNSANYVSNMPPLAASDVVFSTLSGDNLSNVLGRDYTVDGLVFLWMNNGASINGTNTLTLGAGGIDMVAANHSVTINCPVNVGAAQTWAVGPNNPGNTLTDTGNISGTNTLGKDGCGTLFLPRANSFSGPVTIGGGTVAFGAGGLGTGPVTNGGTLCWLAGNTQDIAADRTIITSTNGVFDPNGNFIALSGNISGAGTFAVSGTNAGTIALSGVNTFANGSVSGSAILRTAGSQCLGGGPIAIGSAATNTCRLELSGGITLTNTITPAVRTANLAAHILNVSGTNTLNPATNIALGTGGSQFSLQSDGGKLVLAKGIQAVGGCGKYVYLSGAGDGVIQGAISQASTAYSIFGIVKSGAGSWTVTNLTTSTATLTVNGGTLVLNGTATVINTVVNSGGTLAGNGIVTSQATIKSGGILSPGVAGIGSLAFGNDLTLAAGSTNVMKLNKTAQTNDQLKITGTLTCGGSLVVTNLSGTLAAGDGFKLFNAGGYSGLFANVFLPPLVDGLAWQTDALMTDGTIRIVATICPVISNSVQSDDRFLLSVTGGPVSSPFRLLASANLVLPLTNWAAVRTDTFDLFGSGQFTYSFDPSTSQQFFNVAVP